MIAHYWIMEARYLSVPPLPNHLDDAITSSAVSMLSVFFPVSNNLIL